MKKILILSLIAFTQFLSACGLQVRDTAPTTSAVSANTNSSNNSVFTVGGTATGIPYRKDVKVTINGQEYVISQNGPFTFPKSFTFNSAYNVSVVDLPGGAYTCSLQNASGTVRANVGNVNLTCTCSINTLGAGDGTVSSPTLVYTAQQLNTLAVSGTKSELKNVYRQVCDLDYTGIQPTPLGDSAIPFKGKYDGAGFFILHYHSDETVPSKDHRKGIFGYKNSGVISNLSLSDIVLKADDGMASGAAYMGALAATIEDGSTENIYAENITVDDMREPLSAVGGLFGNQLATFDETCSCCSSSLNLAHIENINVYGGASQNVGIYAGWTRGNVKKVEIVNSAVQTCASRCGSVAGFLDNEGTLENINVQNATVAGNESTGGIAGESAGTINKSAFVGIVDGKTMAGNFGGIVGSSDTSHMIKHSYTISDILSVNGSTLVGAVYGNSSLITSVSFDSTQTCQNCTANIGVDALANTDGLIQGTDDSMKNWDFAYTWCLEPSRYPHLIEVPFSTCQ